MKDTFMRETVTTTRFFFVTILNFILAATPACTNMH